MRVRFAPSPTGYLHVGGARTALFNWLLARRHGGVFVLRIEDTDQDRNKDEHVQAIIDGMNWLGLSHDEGPYFQSDRFGDHKKEAVLLMNAGLAYPIFANDFPPLGDKLSPEYREDPVAAQRRPARPDIRMRADLLRDGWKRVEDPAYMLLDRMAREPFAIAFRVPEGKTVWEDLVHGHMEFDNDTIEDFILVRADGVPLYNMACTSDDIHHRISHVLRGDDHISNTPKQIILYQALGAEVPLFGHMPMILGPDGKRLSKRHGATAVGEYANEGILPEAMANFLALLGWNPGDDLELMKLEQMIALFDPARINKKAAVFDMKKLEWMNGKYLPDADMDLLLRALYRGVPENEQKVLAFNGPTWATQLVNQLKGRVRTVNELVKAARPFLDWPPLVIEDLLTATKLDPAIAKRYLARAFRHLSCIDGGWSPENIEAALRSTAEELQIGFGKLVQPLRIALISSPNGPGIDQTVYLLGRETALMRISAACLGLATAEHAAAEPANR